MGREGSSSASAFADQSPEDHGGWVNPNQKKSKHKGKQLGKEKEGGNPDRQQASTSAAGQVVEIRCSALPFLERVATDLSQVMLCAGAGI